MEEQKIFDLGVKTKGAFKIIIGLEGIGDIYDLDRWTLLDTKVIEELPERTHHGLT